ncbi:unnamed protein product [Sphagnum tenellum]
MATEGHRCDICTWTLNPGTDIEQHNSGLLHRTLLDAFARLTPEEFGRFCQRVALDGPKKGRTCLKQVIKQALKAAPQGQLDPGLGALALWEEPRPLATRDGDALQAVDGSDGVVMVEEPCDWNIKLQSTKYWGPGESAWIIRHFRNEGHNVPDSVQQVIGLEHTISDKGQNKGTYPNLRDLKELSEDCMLIYHGEMVAILLHGYQHPTKNAKNKETCSQKELERSADAWATEFVEKNLRPQLTSWLQELDGFFPKQLPFGTSRIGRTCFSAMAVTENYHSTPHTDRDLSNSVISWF